MTMDSSWKGVIKAGGLSLLVGGAILFFFILSVFIFQVQLPLTAQGYLDNPLPPTLLFSLAAFGEFMLMPGVLGLYFSLKDVNKNKVLLGTAVCFVAIPMFLVSRGQVISLFTIASDYAATADPVWRAAYLATAQLALDASNVFAVMALDLLEVGGIILGLVMLKGVFNRETAYLVIVAGIMTVMGTFGVILEPLTIGTLFGLILNGVWQVVIGIKLYKLS
jgi:hypothetical protein